MAEPVTEQEAQTDADERGTSTTQPMRRLRGRAMVRKPTAEPTNFGKHGVVVRRYER